MAVIVLTLWGIIWPNQQSLEAKDLVQAQSSAETDPQSEFPESLTESPPDAAPTDVHVEATSSLRQDGKDIEIIEGMSAKQISDLLAQEGIVDDAQGFHNYSIEHGKTRKFMVGKFNLSVGMPYEELLELLTIPS